MTAGPHVVWPHYLPLPTTCSPLHSLCPPTIPHTRPSLRTLVSTGCFPRHPRGWLSLPSSLYPSATSRRPSLPSLLKAYTHLSISLLYCFLATFVLLVSTFYSLSPHQGFKSHEGINLCLLFTAVSSAPQTVLILAGAQGAFSEIQAASPKVTSRWHPRLIQNSYGFPIRPPRRTQAQINNNASF